MAEFEDRQFYQYPPFNPIIPAPVWGKDAEYAVPVVSSVGNGPAGPKGEDGGYIPFDELTDEQLEKIYMGASACHTFSTDAYVLTTGTQTQRITIPIENISEYDLLCVDVEGLDLVEDTDYTFMDNYIILNQPITHPNTRVHFKAISYQLADGDRTMNVTRIVNEVKPMFANPVEYMGTSEYPAMTIVKYNGAYYVSKKAVPIWTTPDNAEFWQLTFLYEDVMAVAAGGTGADNAADARENLGITPANIGAATQDDMDDAEAAIGDVDVEEDGSLQEQITALGESVSQLLVAKRFSFDEITIAANAHAFASAAIPSLAGYTFVGMVEVTTNGSSTLLQSFQFNSETNMMYVGAKNLDTVSKTLTFQCTLLYARNGCIALT